MVKSKKIKLKKKGGGMSTEISIGGISKNDIMVFTKHLAVAIKSGLTLFEGLSMLQDQAVGKLKKIIGEVIEVIQSGVQLHEALSKYPKYFSPIYINMVKTGEMAGTLEDNLIQLSDQLRKAYELRQKVKSAMMYPMLIFIAVAGLGFSVAIFVLPKILPLFETLDVELPATTQGLIWISKIFEAHGIAILVGAVLGTIFLLWFLKRDFVKPFTHRFMLKLPVMKKIVRHINLERFTRTLGTLLDSGITLDSALKITAESTDNRAYRSAIEKCIPEVEKGNQLSGAMTNYSSLFPGMTTKLISMGENTGNLDTTLGYLNEYYESEVNHTMKNLSTILEPVLLIGIGVIVGVVAISILGPIYKITGTMRG